MLYLYSCIFNGVCDIDQILLFYLLSYCHMLRYGHICINVTDNIRWATIGWSPFEHNCPLNIVLQFTNHVCFSLKILQDTWEHCMCEYDRVGPVIMINETENMIIGVLYLNSCKSNAIDESSGTIFIFYSRESHKMLIPFNVNDTESMFSYWMLHTFWLILKLFTSTDIVFSRWKTYLGWWYPIHQNKIAKLKRLLNSQTLCMVYYCFDYPYLDYCVDVWDDSCKIYIHTQIS